MRFQTLFAAFTVQLEELQPPVQMRQVKCGKRWGGGGVRFLSILMMNI